MVIGLATGQLERLRAVPAEVAPGHIVQRAGNAGERFADDLAGAVRRAGVTDDPVLDEGLDRSEAALDDVGFVLDDHDQADGFHFSGLFKTANARSGPGIARLPSINPGRAHPPPSPGGEGWGEGGICTPDSSFISEADFVQGDP